jgi:hypothetical protein
MRRTLLTGLSVAFLLTGTATTPATGIPPDLAPPQPSFTLGVAFGYQPGDADDVTVRLDIREGSTLFLIGADALGSHTIDSYEPLTANFWSDQAAAGQVVEVLGVADLPARDEPYRFYCRNHFGMDGLLTIVP